jgi:branched-chain amino acid transport system permease protein
VSSPARPNQSFATLASLTPSHMPSMGACIPGMVLPFIIAIIAGLAAIYIARPLAGDYWTSVLEQVGILMIAAVSLNIVNGFTGQFSMGHAGFMAVGGYIGGATTYYGSLGFLGTTAIEAGTYVPGTFLMLAGIGIGAIVAALLGYLVGLPSLRLRGDYLAIVTLGFGEIIRVILELTSTQVYDATAFNDKPLATLATFPLNGAAGFERIPAHANLFWIFFFVAITCAVAIRMKQSSSGRAFLSIREDEIAARAMGVNLTKYKVRAFVLAAALAGVAGALYAHIGVNPSPTDAGFQRSFEVIIFVVLGGLGSISGAALAAAGLTLLGEVLRGPEAVVQKWWILAALFVLLTVGAIILRASGNRGWRVLAVGSLVILGLGLFTGLSLLGKSAGINLGDYRMIIYAILLVLTMLIRPNGILGVRELWDEFGAAPPKEQRA